MSEKELELLLGDKLLSDIKKYNRYMINQIMDCALTEYKEVIIFVNNVKVFFDGMTEKEIMIYK